MRGPWKWSEDGLRLLDGDGRAVLEVRPSDATEEEFAAVAAVPELVEALVGLLDDTPYAAPGDDDCECGDYESEGECCHSRARALLARLKGE